jgi:hypothetical protein
MTAASPGRVDPGVREVRGGASLVMWRAQGTRGDATACTPHSQLH